MPDASFQIEENGEEELEPQAEHAIQDLTLEWFNKREVQQLQNNNNNVLLKHWFKMDVKGPSMD